MVIIMPIVVCMCVFRCVAEMEQFVDSLSPHHSRKVCVQLRALNYAHVHVQGTCTCMSTDTDQLISC